LKIHLTGYLLEHSVALNWSENGLQLFMFEEILNRSKREFVHDVALPSAARKLDKKLYSTATALTMSSVRDNMTQLSLWADAVWSPSLGQAISQVKDDVEKLYQQETTPGRVWNAEFVEKALNALLEDWAKQSADFQAGIANFAELHPDTEFFSKVKGSRSYLPKPYLLSATTGELNPIVSALVNEFEDDIRRRVEAAALRPQTNLNLSVDQKENNTKTPRKQSRPAPTASWYMREHQVIPFDDISDILHQAYVKAAAFGKKLCFEHNSNTGCRFTSSGCHRDHEQFTAKQIKEAPEIAIILANLGGISGQAKKKAAEVKAMVDNFRKGVGQIESTSDSDSTANGHDLPDPSQWQLNSLSDFPELHVGADASTKGCGSSLPFPSPDLSCIQPAHRQDMAKKSKVSPDLVILKNGVSVSKEPWQEGSSILGVTAQRQITVTYRPIELTKGLQFTFRNLETGDSIQQGGHTFNKTCLFNSVATAMGGNQSPKEVMQDVRDQAMYLRDVKFAKESAHVAHILARRILDDGLQHFNSLRFMAPMELQDKVLVILHRTSTSHLNVQVLVGQDSFPTSRVCWIWGERQHATAMRLQTVDESATASFYRNCEFVPTWRRRVSRRS